MARKRCGRCRADRRQIQEQQQRELIKESPQRALEMYKRAAAAVALARANEQAQVRRPQQADDSPEG